MKFIIFPIRIFRSHRCHNFRITIFFSIQKQPRRGDLVRKLKRLRKNLRSSSSKVVCKKYVLRNFPKFTGKHLSQSLFFNKVAGLSPQLYYKIGYGTGVFLWILRNFWEHLFLKNASGGHFWIRKEIYSTKTVFIKVVIE